MNFGKIVSALGGTGLSGQASEAFMVVEVADFFVNPELLVKEGLNDLSADVILVSARGAAGKSTAAAEMSRRIGAPLWRLEKDKAVSGTSIEYVLSQYLGKTDVESCLEGFRPTIIIDSLDEARSRVSGTSWMEFLQSLAEMSRSICRLVLLGRERTLEDVWLSLVEAGRQIAWLEISHFGADERLQYIDGAVRSRKPEAVESVHYAPARDAILSSLVGAVPDKSAETFAGYAPVLDAVAAALQDNGNLYAIPTLFAASSQDGRHLRELKLILTELLDRDQKKMRPVAVDIGLDPNDVYTPEEQIDWLCHELAGAPAPTLEYIVNGRIRDEYVQKVLPFVADHPFRDEGRWASAVFRAYVAVRRFGTTISGPDLVDVGNESGLLFDLVTLDTEETLIDEWQLAALHASVTAGEFSDTSTTVTATELEGGIFSISVSLHRPAEAVTKTFTLVPGEIGEIRLFGPLEGLTVETNGGVTIPARGTPVVLGPDLFIHCNSLAVEGGTLEFAQRGAPASGDVTFGGVTLEVERALRLPGEIARRPLDDDFQLRVFSWVKLSHPWAYYREELPVEEEVVDINARSVRFLNMLMNLTRAHGHSGERGAFMMKLQGRQSIKGEELQCVLRLLEKSGIVKIDGLMIFLTAEYEPYRFSGKTLDGRRLIGDVWDVWGPIVERIEGCLRS